MVAELDEVLNDLLARWHEWSRRYAYASGYPSVDSTCRDARTSKQYEEDDGGRADDFEMECFDAAMDNVPQPWRTALSFQARNLVSGANVWNSLRLPASPEERAVLLLEARNKLLREWEKKGMSELKTA